MARQQLLIDTALAPAGAIIRVHGCAMVEIAGFKTKNQKGGAYNAFQKGIKPLDAN